jgi:hypothetical protein
MEKTAKKRIIVQGVIFTVSFAFAFFGAKYLFSNNKDTPNEMLVKNSKEMNKSMPKMLDAQIRLDSTSVENVTLNYYYTLINIDKDSTFLDFETVKSEMIKKAQGNLDTNPVMKEYRENNISLHYILKDKNKKSIFDYTVKNKTEN